MIDRHAHAAEVKRLLKSFPAVALVGARQVAKSTLAHHIVATLGRTARLFDLESDRDQRLLQEPEAISRTLHGLVVIDEVQRMPSLFPPLRSEPLAVREKT